MVGETETIEIRLNGRLQRVASGTTVARLLVELGVPAGGTAVELEGNLLSAGELDRTLLRPGARLEIVRLVGGG